jgi:hypothetical protein
MNGRIVFGVLLAVLLMAGAIGIGVYAYNFGVAQGMADSGKLAAPAAGAAPYLYWHRPWGLHPFGFGLGFVNCLFPLLFFLLLFGLCRAFIRRGRWGWGGMHHRHWDGGIPPMVEEWHRKMHEPQPTTPKS